MRLFVAIDLEDETRAAIVREQKRLGQLFARAQPRWVRTEQLHLTLVFIGEVEHERVAGIVEAMSRDIPRLPFNLLLGGLGLFPSDGAPRILWIGVLEGARQVVDVQQDVVRRLESAGVRSDERPFRPHLTIGRWRHGRQADRLRAATASIATIPAGTIDGVTLYESRISSTGAAHFPVAKARLRPT